jgi:hypothetical protein
VNSFAHSALQKVSTKTGQAQKAYQLSLGISDDIHLFNEKLREWEGYCNCHRPHGALSGQPRMSGY